MGEVATCHVVQMSGGQGSWFAARRVVEQIDTPDSLLLLFADTRTEDDDLYRFLGEASADVLGRLPPGATGRLVTLTDGRDVWDVFDDVRYIGNTRIDPCSRILKRTLIREWLDTNLDPASSVIYLGIDWTESERFERAQAYWSPWDIRAPLCDPPYCDREQVSNALAEADIRPPRLYELGFTHNNCGGFCVKAGHAQFRLLLEKFPERYAYHESREEKWRADHGKDVSVLRDRRGGTTRPLTLRRFRQEIEAGTADIDPADVGACACFTPDEYPEAC